MDMAVMGGAQPLFARSGERDYMMRSEKRPGYRPTTPPSPTPPKRRKQRRQGNLPYVFCTFLLLIAVYPVGLCMLWARRIRYTVTTKLCLTAAFAVVFVPLVSLLLTFPVQNETVTAMQKSARDGLGRAGTAITSTVNKLDLDPESIRKDAEDIAGYSIELARQTAFSLIPMLDSATIDISRNTNSILSNGVEIVRSKARELMYGFKLIPTPEPGSIVFPTEDTTPTPIPTSTPTAGLGSLSATATPAPTALLAWYVTGDKEYHTRSVCPKLEGTPISMTVTEAVHRGLLPCDMCAIPDALGSVAEVTAAEGTGILRTPNPSYNPSDHPTPIPTPRITPRPTPVPTPILLPPAKSAADAVVYFTSNGQYYHTGTNCGSMRGAAEHTLKEAVEKGLKRCNSCGAPDPELLTTDVVVWSGTNRFFHITDDCEKLEGRATLMSLDQAMLEEGYHGCEACGANLYEEVAMKYANPTAVPAPPIG